MFDRLKNAPADAASAERDGKPDNAMPRFQPQPGGFGRRTTPVGTKPGETPPAATAMPVATPTVSAPAAPAQAPVARYHSIGSSANAGSAAQFRKQDPSIGPIGNSEPGAASGPAMGDVATRIADWMMRELKDERGVHCETILTTAGALAGYAAQQALWEAMVKQQDMAIAEVFRVVEVRGEENLFFGDELDEILVSMDPKRQSIWKIVASDALAAAGEHLPDVGNLLRYCEATAGTMQFGLPRLPDGHLPGMLPRAALERFWPGARRLLGSAEPLTWPLHMAHSARKLMSAMKTSIAPDLAVKIVMEAAVPMSRVDPKTVPSD